MSWSLTVPADTDLASLGAGVIRTMKTDLQTALTTEGIFPGPTPATPIYRWTPRVGNTASRPAPNSSYPGSVYYNTDVNQLQLDNGTAWIDLCDQIFPGAISAAAISSTPPSSSWLYCNGQAVSRTTYAALFAAIGTAHGQGDGSTTFNVPDYRGQFLRMVDGGAGRDPDTSSRTAMATGGNTGDAVGSVQADATDVNGLHDTGHQHEFGELTQGTNAVLGSGGSTPIFGSTWSNTVDTQNSTAALAGDDETRPTNAYVNYFIHI